MLFFLRTMIKNVTVWHYILVLFQVTGTYSYVNIPCDNHIHTAVVDECATNVLFFCNDSGNVIN